MRSNLLASPFGNRGTNPNEAFHRLVTKFVPKGRFLTALQVEIGYFLAFAFQNELTFRRVCPERDLLVVRDFVAHIELQCGIAEGGLQLCEDALVMAERVRDRRERSSTRQMDPQRRAERAGKRRKEWMAPLLIDPLLEGANLADYEPNADARRALMQQNGKTRRQPRGSSGRRMVGAASKPRLELAFDSIASDSRFSWAAALRPKKSKPVADFRDAWKHVENECKSRGLNVPIIPKKK